MVMDVAPFSLLDNLRNPTGAKRVDNENRVKERVGNALRDFHQSEHAVVVPE
jgi:hypothetical protein